MSAAPAIVPTTAPLVTCHGVTVALGGARVVDKVDLAIHEAQIVSLIGPNGSGKTTLVRAILGLTRPTLGRVERRPGLSIGYVPQRLMVDRSLPMTVARFLNLTRRYERGEMIAELDRLGVGGLADRGVQDLSGGEWQRVLLARAVVGRPDLLVLDEPAQGVDVVGQSDLYRHIRDLRDRLGCGVLLVSHDLHLVMASTDEVLCLNHHVCCTGRPEIVANHPAYVELFGRAATAELAVYTHHHDHTHGPEEQGHSHG